MGVIVKNKVVRFYSLWCIWGCSSISKGVWRLWP